MQDSKYILTPHIRNFCWTHGEVIVGVFVTVTSMACAQLSLSSQFITEGKEDFCFVTVLL